MSGKNLQVRSARLDAPSFREYRMLKHEARHKIPEKFRESTLFVLVSMGELGLRAGEVSHMRQSWVDVDNKVIRIPSYEQCNQGQDGGVCGYCKQQAKQALGDGSYDSYEEALADRWTPKNEESARTVPYGWSDEIVDIYDRFFYKHDGYPYCRTSINRRISRLAEASEIFDDRNDLYPHAFRGHAGKLHASNGINALQLKKFMGWGSVRGALPYIKMAAKDVQAAFTRVYE
ncbi:MULTISPECIES: tyrosine-type recombinase/integrase [Haloferax]|nr:MULTISPECIES: tyrosine-type recombinase/integrase [Haloferax]